MKSRWMVWLLAFSVGLNVALVVMLVREGASAEAAKPPSPLLTLPVGHRLLQVNEERLGLTPEQREAFRVIRDRWDAEERRQRLLTLERMLKISRLIAGGELTSEALAPVLEQARETSVDFTSRLLDAFREQAAVLTPEQNQLYREILERRWNYIRGVLEKHLQELNEPQPSPTPAPPHCYAPPSGGHRG